MKQFDNEKTPICPHCEHKHDDESFYYGKEKSSKGDSEQKVWIDCEHCKEPFESSIDLCNQCLGYNSYVINCEELKKKHKYVLKGIHESKKDETKYNTYYCSVCDDLELKQINDEGRELTKKEIDKFRRSKEEINQPLQKGKQATLYVDKLSFHINTDKAEGNRDLFLICCKVLKSLGYTVNENEDIKKNYNCLSYYRKAGSKKDLHFEADYFPAGMKFDFFTLDDGKRTYGLSSENYRKLPYLTKKQSEYTIKKLAEHLSSLTDYNFKLHVPKNLDWHNRPVLDNLSKKEAIAKIKAYPVKFDRECKDKDGKVLENGDFRYAYDYNNKLVRGLVYHNINNMCWLLTEDQYFNIASFYLFEYTPGTPLKKVDSQARLNSLLKQAIDEKNFNRCLVLDKVIKGKAS